MGTKWSHTTSSPLRSGIACNGSESPPTHAACGPDGKRCPGMWLPRHRDALWAREGGSGQATLPGPFPLSAPPPAPAYSSSPYSSSPTLPHLLFLPTYSSSPYSSLPYSSSPYSSFPTLSPPPLPPYSSSSLFLQGKEEMHYTHRLARTNR